jgi:dTDP-4-dehydrorhamnose reductase
MRSVLILGASGYVGQFLAQNLLQTGQWKVYAGQSSHDASWPESILPLTVDVTSLESISAAVGISAPSVVVNCAAMAALGACEASPEAAFAVNCPLVLIQCLNSLPLDSRPFLVHLSTDIVFPGLPSDENRYTEDECVTLDGALNVYGRTKAAFELALAAKAEFVYVVLRCSNILGGRPPYTHGKHTVKFVEWLLGEMIAGKPLKMFSDEVRSYVAVSDVVAFIGHCCNHSSTLSCRVYCLGGPKPLTRVAVATAVAASIAHRFASTIEPTRRCDVKLPYDAPLNAAMNSCVAERELGRPFLDIETWLTTDVVPDLLPRLASSV